MCKQHAQCMTFKIYVRTWYRSEASMQRTRNNLRRFLQFKQTYKYCPPIPNKPTLQAPNLWKYDFSFNIFWVLTIVLTVLEKGHILALFRIHFGVHSCSFSANEKRIKKESLCISGSQPMSASSRKFTVRVLRKQFSFNLFQGRPRYASTRVFFGGALCFDLVFLKLPKVHQFNVCVAFLMILFLWQLASN